MDDQKVVSVFKTIVQLYADGQVDASCFLLLCTLNHQMDSPLGGATWLKLSQAKITRWNLPRHA